jgi:hypothetical protein
MKKISTIIIFIFGIVLNTWCQISLVYENQSIVTGDSHHFRLTEMVDEGPAGPNQVWDFSALKATGDLTSYMIDALQTPDGTKIPEATSVIKEGQNNFYFKVSKKEIEEYGLASCNVVYKYDQPLVKMKFPFNYGDKIQGQFHGTDVNNPAIQLNGTYKVEADAYGKLILPNNVVISDVLRMKSSRTDGIGNSTNTTVTYRWYSKNVRYPLLTIIKYENAGNYHTSLTAYYADAGSTIKNKSDNQNDWIVNEDFRVSIYPNPYVERANINYVLYKPSNISISIVDYMGKSIKTIVNQTQDAGQYTESFAGRDFGLKAGVYLVRVIVNGKIETTKLIQL